MSRNKGVPVERMCRLEGQKPTLRDRWLAFYRLYRLSMNQGVHQDMAAVDCFRVLWSNWAYIRLCEAQVDLMGRAKHMPKFLYKSLLNSERQRRLYRSHPEWKGRDKIVAAMLRNGQGIEVTPDQVAEVRAKVIKETRRRAEIMQIPVPPDDEDLLRMLKQAGV